MTSSRFGPWLRGPRAGLFIAALALAACQPSGAAAAPPRMSQLWGRNGEKWSPQSRLPDFSFAGYRRGEEPFRIPPDSISVADYGARGDGQTDDTRAFQKAIKEGGGKVVLVPAGRFVLSDQLEIRSSNLVLRGAGPSKSILVFTRSLDDLKPRPTKNDGNQSTSGWSWDGGLITIGGRARESGRTTGVAEAAGRGANRVTLQEPLFKTGDEVVISIQDDSQRTLVDYLYRGQGGDISGLNNFKCSQVFRVVAADGRRLTLDRGLRFELRPAWRPKVQPFQPGLVDVGVEGIAFTFPDRPYAGHFKEVGFNPIEIEASAAHCWIKDILVWNGDSGPYIHGTFCTLDGVRLGADPGRVSTHGQTGHHGITFVGYDCLCTHFSIETQFIHDLTAQSCQGCVFCSGRALNLCMDHHRWAPYENLFTDIDAGDGRRLFASSGGGMRGMHTAAGATFWNIRAAYPVPWPKDFGPQQINLVGVPVVDTPVMTRDGRWLEPLLPGRFQPANLYEAMLDKRLGHNGPGPRQSKPRVESATGRKAASVRAATENSRP